MSDVTDVNADIDQLAPRFAEAVRKALAKCNDAARPGGPLNAKVFEGFRSNARQAWLYAQGRTRSGDIVTHASSSLTSWHGYGLAVDIVHKDKFWNPFGKDEKKNEQWFANVAEVFKATECNWGGDWNHPDTPHMQWGHCPASPTPAIRALMTGKGVAEVWRAMNAIDMTAAPPPAPAASAGGTPESFGTLVPGGFFSADPADTSVRRSIRTNNPGALNISAWQRAYPGYYGETPPDSAGNRTTIYLTPEQGVGAWYRLLTVRYAFGATGTVKLAELARRYAGVDDAQSAAVRNYVRGWAGASRGTLAEDSEIALGQDDQVLRLARAMFFHEAGQPSPLHDDQILFGVQYERDRQ